MQVSFCTPVDDDMIVIRAYIKEFVLDDENLMKEQFVIAKSNHQIIGFGRLRTHSDCTELCTLGVIPEHRGKGIGKKLVEQLIQRAFATELFVVCIIPEFFMKFGFELVSIYPSSIKRKHSICTTHYVVKEKYSAMVLRITI